MPWSHPAPRMREFILAMRAIWSAWNDGEKLDFRGEFYTHTLMTPFFSPGPNPYGPPPVMLAAVGDKMTEVAGEVADGMILHPFTTERYVREVTLGSLDRGFANAGDKTRADFTLALPLFVVTGTNDEEWAAARKGTREQIAFYGSTPGYHGVLRLHGWEEVGLELNQLSKRGEWVAMGELITDEMLETFAVVAPPDELAAGIIARYGDVLDRLSFDAPYAVRSRGLDAVDRRPEGRRLTCPTPPRPSARLNSAFYAALEACDLDAMADVWEHSDRVSVTHPGLAHAARLGEGRGFVGRDLPQHRLHPVRAHRRAGRGRRRRRVGHARREHPAVGRCRRAVGLEGDARPTCSCATARATAKAGAWSCTTAHPSRATASQGSCVSIHASSAGPLSKLEISAYRGVGAGVAHDVPEPLRVDDETRAAVQRDAHLGRRDRGGRRRPAP